MSSSNRRVARSDLTALNAHWNYHELLAVDNLNGWLRLGRRRRHHGGTWSKGNGLANRLHHWSWHRKQTHRGHRSHLWMHAVNWRQQLRSIRVLHERGLNKRLLTGMLRLSIRRENLGDGKRCRDLRCSLGLKGTRNLLLLVQFHC